MGHLCFAKAGEVGVPYLGMREWVCGGAQLWQRPSGGCGVDKLLVTLFGMGRGRAVLPCS